MSCLATFEGRLFVFVIWMPWWWKLVPCGPGWARVLFAAAVSFVFGFSSRELIAMWVDNWANLNPNLLHQGRSASRRPVHGISHSSLWKYPADLENLFLNVLWVEDEVFGQNVCFRDSKRHTHCSWLGWGDLRLHFVLFPWAFIHLCAEDGRQHGEGQTLFPSHWSKHAPFSPKLYPYPWHSQRRINGMFRQGYINIEGEMFSLPAEKSNYGACSIKLWSFHTRKNNLIKVNASLIFIHLTDVGNAF